jgi:hypothetical protein
VSSQSVEVLSHSIPQIKVLITTGVLKDREHLLTGHFVRRVDISPDLHLWVVYRRQGSRLPVLNGHQGEQGQKQAQADCQHCLRKAFLSIPPLLLKNCLQQPNRGYACSIQRGRGDSPSAVSLKFNKRSRLCRRRSSVYRRVFRRVRYEH